MSAIDFHTLPKVELHRHLEGSVRPATILEIARRYDLPLPATKLDDLKTALYVTEPMESIQQVFARFRPAQQSFAGPEEVERISREIIEDAAADGVALVELRFSPAFMTQIHALPWDELLDAVSSGVRLAQREHEIEVGLIVIASRDLGVERCDETVEFCVEHLDRIVGIDLAGDETRWPARRFQSAFDRAARAGLRITVHAGEIGPPSEIEDALSLLHAERIGHGVQAVESPALVADLVRERIPLELCPTSNVMTRSAASFATHPLQRLLRAGVVTTLSSDDPEVFGITLTHEYEVCGREMGLTAEELVACNRHALDSTFLPRERTEWMREQMEGGL